jgi:hypothetical protein
MDIPMRHFAHLHDLPATTIAELAEGVASGASLAAIPAGYARRYAAVEPGLDTALSFATTPEARDADLAGLDPTSILLVEIHAPPAVLRRLELRAAA